VESVGKSGTPYPRISLNVGRIVNRVFCVRDIPEIERKEITSGRCKVLPLAREEGAWIGAGRDGHTRIAFGVASAGMSGAHLEAAFSRKKRGVNHVLSAKFGSRGNLGRNVDP